MTENKILSHLIAMGISAPDSIHEFYPRVRDRSDVQVLRCDKSDVILLSSTDHLADTHYANQSGVSYWGVQDRKQALLECYEDDSRRAKQFEALIRNKRWLDVGTGVGGILDLLSVQAAEVHGIEPQVAIRQELIRCGYQIHECGSEAPDEHFQVVTLFHVFEHLSDPLEALREIMRKMVVGGRIIIEVPHAKDALIAFYQLEAFKRFTFWSEHLILHTRESLRAFLHEAGFSDIHVMAYQRYSLANHLYWLAHGRPGGHKEWSVLMSDELNKAYAAKLAELDLTDTLIAFASK